MARLKVRIDDLWASHESFEEGIAEAFTQRNSLLHAGKITSPEEAFGNLWRIRIFVERLFLRAIDFPDTLLAWEHTQTVAQANRAREIRSNPGRYAISSWTLVPKRWQRKPFQTSEQPEEPEVQRRRRNHRERAVRGVTPSPSESYIALDAAFEVLPLDLLI